MHNYTKIAELAAAGRETMIARRRDFHRYAEAAWTEFRTAAIVADTLAKLGYEVLAGDEVITGNVMYEVPSAIELEHHIRRAITQGAKSSWVRKMAGGKTGIVGIMRFSPAGPAVGLRFDMDANTVTESDNPDHYPRREGFASVNRGVMHACGHDGHTAVGLAVAEILAAVQGSLSGSVILMFQPAEEGAHGATAMVDHSFFTGLDYLLGMHLGLKTEKTGQVACNVQGFLANTKLDVMFNGTPAHAGAKPEEGRNALLAAAAAALNLHAIPRHSGGATRINVGLLSAGSARNVIPATAELKLETRGANDEINDFMIREARQVINAAALMYGVDVKITAAGHVEGGCNSPKLANFLTEIAVFTGAFSQILPVCEFGASDDFTLFMNRVQKAGGQAAYVMIGADLASGHHSALFDFDENALMPAVLLLGSAAVRLLAGPRAFLDIPCII